MDNPQADSVLRCFKCEQPIAAMLWTSQETGETHDTGNLDDGMRFTSPGGYGSTVYDSMGRQFLRIHVCDDCVKDAAARHLVLEGTRIPRGDDYEYEWFVPYEEE